MPEWFPWALIAGFLTLLIAKGACLYAGDVVPGQLPIGYPLSAETTKLSLVLVPSALLVVWLLGLELARRRYGEAEFRGEEAAFKGLFALAGVEERSLRDVIDRRSTPHGVLLTFRGSRWLRRTFLVPADEEQQAAVFAYLDAIEAPG